MKQIIISAETDLGVDIDGSSIGARELTTNALFKDIEVVHITQPKNYIKSKSDDDLQKNIEEINKYNNKLFNTILAYEENNYFPITVGGDHSVSIGSTLASQKIHENIGVIWIDAHPDFNTFETTETGNIHGLPLATISGYHNDSLRKFSNSFINPENVVIIGTRSIDDLELENLEKANIKYFTTEDIKIYGVLEIIKKAFMIAGKNTNGIHVSFDLDIIDPKSALGVSVPVENGISINDAFKINELLLNHIDKIVSYDLVEYNKLLDKDDKTKDIALKLLKQVIDATKEKE